ncbi:MAG: sigma-70 family RNA polymerase sigma factor [Bryobacteraceae bacterium]
MKSCKALADRNDCQIQFFEKIYPIVRRTAAVRSARLTKLLRLCPDDQFDLQQDAAFRVWQSLRFFDATRAGPATFIELVVGRTMSSTARRLLAAKRQPADQPTPLKCFSATPEAIHLRLDVGRVLARLPARQRLVARLLVDLAPSEVARATGVSRATIYREIALLRVAFVVAGLGSTPSPSRTADRT